MQKLLEKRHLKWGVLGTARINQKVVPSLALTDRQSLVAIASRDYDRAKEQGSILRAEKIFGSYEELLDCKEVDAIYNSLPNHLHFEWSRKALLKGKHVLCEKPIALRAEEVSELAEIATKHGLLVQEAFMYRNCLQIVRLLELLDSGVIGEIHSVHSSFHYPLTNSDDYRNRPEYGGGVMWDLGCYLVNLSNRIFKSFPSKIYFDAHYENGVDTISSALLSYGAGMTASLNCSFRSRRSESLEIIGTKGKLKINHPIKGGQNETIEIFHSNSHEILNIQDTNSAYLRQFESFFDTLLGRPTAAVSIEESASTVRTIELLLNSRLS